VHTIQSIEQIGSIVRTLFSKFPDINSEELKMFLRNVRCGGRIVLCEGVYEGEFFLEKDDVQIVGQGDGKTVLKGLKQKNLFVDQGKWVVSGFRPSNNCWGRVGEQRD
jgi:hypothetical protein